MNLDCKKPKLCVPNPPVKEIYPPPTPPFEQCVGDYVWTWDGTRLTRDRVRTTPDGTYTAVTLINGCPVGYGYDTEAIYTPPYCNPNPADCQQGPGVAEEPVVARRPYWTSPFPPPLGILLRKPPRVYTREPLSKLRAVLTSPARARWLTHMSFL